MSTAVCLAAPLLTLALGKPYLYVVLLLPMGNCLLVWGAILGRPWPTYSLHIRERYPTIWNKLHPWGDLSRNTFTALAFARGEYDDGADPRLNELKTECKATIVFQLWAFALIPASWLVLLGLSIFFVSCQPQK